MQAGLKGMICAAYSAIIAWLHVFINSLKGTTSSSHFLELYCITKKNRLHRHYGKTKNRHNDTDKRNKSHMCARAYVRHIRKAIEAWKA